MDPEHATMADTYATVYRATRPQELAHVAVCDESEFRYSGLLNKTRNERSAV